jgi:competence CoiA-like predicted nuclease
VHEPESLAHVQAKLMLAEWLRGTGCLVVSVERFDTQSQRKPDVSVMTATGERIAL